MLRPNNTFINIEVKKKYGDSLNKLFLNAINKMKEYREESDKS
jgi:hypothetical protein